MATKQTALSGDSLLRSRRRSCSALSILVLLHVSFVVSEGRNLAVTSDGVAVATRSPELGLTTFDAARGRQADHDVLMMGGRTFDDVTIDPFAGSTGADGKKKQFVFAISVASRRVCSLQLLNEGGYFLAPIGCASTEVAVSPYTGISAWNGTLVVSGGTGGMSVFAYDTERGVIDDTPSVLNRELPGVIGHPDVALITPTLAALSTDFDSTPRFGSLVVSVDGSDVESLRDFRVEDEDSVGFDFALSPANFPLVNAIYHADGAGTYMYTANGPITVQDPTRDGDAVIVRGYPEGFTALTAAVNAEKKRAVFGGLVMDDDDTTSSIVLFDIDQPLQPAFVSMKNVDTTGGGRITSIATSGDFILYVAEDSAEVGMVRIDDTEDETMPPSAVPTRSPSIEEASQPEPTQAEPQPEPQPQPKPQPHIQPEPLPQPQPQVQPVPQSQPQVQPSSAPVVEESNDNTPSPSGNELHGSPVKEEESNDNPVVEESPAPTEVSSSPSLAVTTGALVCYASLAVGLVKTVACLT